MGSPNVMLETIHRLGYPNPNISMQTHGVLYTVRWRSMDEISLYSIGDYSM